MVQKDRRDALLLVHNVSDTTVYDDIDAEGGEHPRLMSSNLTERHLQRTRRINLVSALSYV